MSTLRVTYKNLFLVPLALLLLSNCDAPQNAQSEQTETPPVTIERTGWLSSAALMEASGIQASHTRDGIFFVHNDEGQPFIYAIDETGADLGGFFIVPAKNKDWEDMTSVPVDGGSWIVAGDIGDNMAKRKSIKLYFAEEPTADSKDRYDGVQELKHWLSLKYPDGPRDCESLAYDPVGKQILLLSKRDKPARLYAIDLETALSKNNAELKFLGTISVLRPPTPANRARFGGRTDYISQPTGFDISSDGTEAVIITYRSLYRFERQQDESWLSALQRKPTEMEGPLAPQNEAIAYSIDGKSIYVTSEKTPAALYRVRFNP